MMSSKMAAARALIELFELVKTTGRTPDQTVFYSYSRMQITSIPRPTYNKKLRRLERHGLVKKVKTPQGHVFHITAKAKSLRHKAATKILRQDGLSSLIIFDIPEAKHNARDILRRYLIKSGYTKIRDSSFISPFKISDDLKNLIAELQLQQNVTIFSAKISPLK